jgi:predicted dehydrogenase
MAFAGVGWLGESLIKDLPSFPQLRLEAVQDARAETASRVAAEYGAAWHGVGYSDLLAQPGVDAIAISTPNALHASQAAEALRAGKHVLVQKPLALSFGDASGLIDLSRETRRLLFVDYSYRFLDTLRVLRDEGKRPRSITAVFHNIYGPGTEKAWFFDPKLSGGGALIDLGVHLLDLALWLVEPRSVDLLEADLDGAPIEHRAALRLQVDDVRVDLAVSWNADLPETAIFLDVEAERGRVRWENVAGSFFRFRTVRDDEVLLERETTLREDTLRAFCAALDSGEAPPIDPRVYAVLDQAYAKTRD